jgi:hypothetical protein
LKLRPVRSLTLAATESCLLIAVLHACYSDLIHFYFLLTSLLLFPAFFYVRIDDCIKNYTSSSKVSCLFVIL